MTISYIEIDGGRLVVEVEGNGPLVICSPALGDTRESFAPLGAYLIARGYQVARLDLRGQGDNSASFNRYGDEATADDLLASIETLRAGPVVLAGASLSAGAAVIAAGRRPEQVAGLVLLSPFLRNGASKAVRAILHIALAKPWGPFVWPLYASKLWPGLGAEARERAARTTALLKRPGRWSAFHATSAVNHDEVTPWLGRVRAPVLVVIGEADPDWKDPLAEAAWVASNFSDARTVPVPGAGHAPMFERPGIVDPAVFEFLETLRLGNTFRSANG